MKHVIGLLLLVSMTMLAKSSPEDYTVKIVDKNEIKTAKSAVSNLWLSSNREYPYLYVGNIEIARGYFDLIESTGIIAIVYKNQDPVGFIGAVPLKEMAQRYTVLSALFKQARINISDCYYITDVILMAEHRGNRLSPKLFQLIEDQARSYGFSTICLMCEGHESHPLKPKNYRELDALWLKLGYTKSTIIAPFNWLTVLPDTTLSQQEHMLTFWFKSLL